MERSYIESSRWSGWSHQHASVALLGLARAAMRVHCWLDWISSVVRSRGCTYGQCGWPRQRQSSGPSA